MTKKQYVLLTAARNEESYIEETIISVINQIIRPKRWIIISDGSKDRTDEIVNSFTYKYSFIQLLRVSGDENRHFGSKVNALNAGYSLLQDIEYDFIGNLDADISLDRDYFAQILTKLDSNPRLGIAGGLVHELVKGKYKKLRISLNSVSGAIQMFRKECYKDIGGLIALTYGGEDAAAEIMARMNGWEVRTFPDIRAFQRRRMGAANQRMLRAKFRNGIMFYELGYHPVFQLFRCIFRIADRPFFIGAFLEYTGYFWSFISRHKVKLHEDTVKYLRKEQMARLMKLLVLGRKGEA